MERLVNNPAVKLRRWYKPIAQQIITAASVAGQLHLGMDCSKVSSSHQLLMVALTYNGRALVIDHLEQWRWDYALRH